MINLLIIRSFTIVAVAIVFVNTLGVSMWTIISPANKNIFVCLFPICVLFVLSPYCAG